MNIIGKSREQMALTCWNDFVPLDNPARQIDRFVDEMDTSYFLFSVHDSVGRRPYNPKDMLKLYLYGNDKGVFSSRKLERECRENIVVFWLLNGLTPESKTICNFRKDNAKNLKRFFHEFAKKLASEGLITGKIVGIDGTKIRANNAGDNCFNLKRVSAKIENIEKRLAEFLVEIDKNDEADGLTAKRKAKLDDKHKKLIAIKRRIENGEAEEISTTDPDSRMMRMANGGKNVCHNVQSAVDSQNKLIAGFEVKSNQNDQGLLYEVAKSVKENLNVPEMTVLADTGYYDADELGKCHADNIETLVSVLEPRKDSELYPKKKFSYDEQNDRYICPVGQFLTHATISNSTKQYRNTKACKNCPSKERCTTGEYRTVSHHINYAAIKRNAEAIAKNKAIHKKRGRICEHPFGTIKHNMRFVQFLTRGNVKVTGEAALLFVAYNLKRLRTIAENGKTDNEAQAKTGIIFIIYFKTIVYPVSLVFLIGSKLL